MWSLGRGLALAVQPGTAVFSYFHAGDLPKQVKLKKLAKLKTLDTKPGEPPAGPQHSPVAPAAG